MWNYKPKINETDQKSIINAIIVNSIFPMRLNSLISKNKIYQIATDCVFDGKINFILKMPIIMQLMFTEKPKV